MSAPASTRRPPNAPSTPARRGRRWARAALAGTCSFLAGVATATALAREAGSPPQSAPGVAPGPSGAAGPATNAGPRAVEAGVPVGFSHDAPGAAAAATSYLTVAAEGLLLMDGPAREAALARMLVPDASAQTVASVAGDPALLDRVRRAGSASGSLRAVVRNIPVAYRVEALSAARARVAVWSTAVWTIAGVGGPAEAWSTTTLELEWVEGDWRLWSLTAKDGPTPATTSGPVTGADALVSDLAGFSSYRYGPA